MLDAYYNSNEVLVWLTVSHTLFLVVPGVIALAYEWVHHAKPFRFNFRIHTQKMHFPHYLAHG